MRLDRTEARILGALIEKGWTTPEQYPLTLNALRSACNQKSNRDPVLQLNALEIERSILALRPRGLMRQHERDSGRVPRFEGLLAKELGLRRQEEAIVAELLLRGPQTAPELARRCSRMATYTGASEVEALLGGLAERDLVQLLPRQSGRRHARWTQLLTGDAPASEASPPTATPPAATPPAATHAAPYAPQQAEPTAERTEQSSPYQSPYQSPSPAPAPSAASAAHAAPAAAPSDEVAELRAVVETLREDLEAVRGEVEGLRTRLDELTGM